MFQNIEVFRLSQALAGHAAARQAVIAINIANADTPGFKALAMPPLPDAGKSSSPDFRKTRPGHISSPPTAQLDRSSDISNATSPNGNSVNIENELLKAAETEQNHSRAIAVYHSALGILRSSLGRR